MQTINKNDVVRLTVTSNNRNDLFADNNVYIELLTEVVNDLLDYKVGKLEERNEKELISGIKSIKVSEMKYALSDNGVDFLLNQRKKLGKVADDIEVYLHKAIRYIIRNFDKVNITSK